MVKKSLFYFQSGSNQLWLFIPQAVVEIRKQYLKYYN